MTRFEEIDVRDLLPQREPLVMVDRLLHCDTVVTCTSLRVDEGNVFREGDALSAAGVIEHVAQTCAARMGYMNKYVYRDAVKIGFIGAIRELEIERLPRVGETMTTRVEVVEEVFRMTLVKARTRVGEEVVATCEMKIAITDLESDEHEKE